MIKCAIPTSFGDDLPARPYYKGVNMKAIVQFEYGGKVFSFNMIDSNQVAEMLKHKTFYEHWMLDFIRKNFRGGTFVDAGAHTGNHAIFFSAFCNCDVIAIEPSNIAYNFLLDNIEINRLSIDNHILCIKNAIGEDYNREAYLVGGDSDKAGSATVGYNKVGQKVTLTTIDVLCASIKDVRLIKIDVEGMELEAVKGAMKTIKKHKPELFIESHYNPYGLEETLKPFGYELKERYCHAPVYHFSTQDRIPRTYKKPI